MAEIIQGLDENDKNGQNINFSKNEIICLDQNNQDSSAKFQDNDQDKIKTEGMGNYLGNHMRRNGALDENVDREQVDDKSPRFKATDYQNQI